MKNPLINKKGMLVLALAAGLIFVAIIFAGITNRMRGEAFITNRVSVNERLSQLASAIGRYSIRKLEKYFRLRDQKFGAEIRKAFFMSSKSEIESELKRVSEQATTDFTKRINSEEIVCNLKDDFKKRWGKTIDVALEYKVVLEDDVNFGAPISGVVDNPYEHSGYISMIVTVNLKDSGVKRVYEVRKDFLFTRLLPVPFHRFTLFSHKGAEVKDKFANSISYDYQGSVVQGQVDSNNKPKRPFVCLNRHINDTAYCRDARHYAEKDKAELCIKNNKEVKDKGWKTSDAFVKNGWIYLGGQGEHCSTKKDDNSGSLILNVVPGNADDGLDTKFGEGYQFYWKQGNNGWLVFSDDTPWQKFINNNGIKSSDVSLCYIRYGIYNGLTDLYPFKQIKNSSGQLRFPHLTDYHLFKYVPEMYSDSVKNNSINDINNPADPAYSIKKNLGSSMHLFGASNTLTPTLIFGKVNRRYLLCFGLVIRADGNSTFPLRGADNTGPMSNTSLQTLFANDLYYRYRDAGLDTDGMGLFFSDFQKIFNSKSDPVVFYYVGDSEVGNFGLGPQIVDKEPYMESLVHLSDPYNPDPQKAAENNFFNKPEDICVEDFVFTSKHSSESKYEGSIKDIKIDYDDYLKTRTTYTLPLDDKKTIKISEDQFFKDHFFDENGNFVLNQIIRVECDLEIDKPLHVSRGGIIVCTGKITISDEVRNNYLHGNKEDPDCFGYVTFVAKNGIEIKKAFDAKPLKLVEGIFIAGCSMNGEEASVENSVGEPIRIIGGVVSDRIDNLVKTGCMVEWGFNPDESTHFNESQFYGLNFGPRDKEIYSGD